MDFTSLLKLANKQTAASQAELAAKEVARQAALKAEQVAASKRAVEEKRLAEERRVLREERERKARQEEERRLKELPKTRNLWALKQERIKRGLNPDGSDDWKLEEKQKKKAIGIVKKERSATSSPRASGSSAKAPEDKAAARKRKMFKEDYDDEPSGSMALLHAFGGAHRSVSPAGPGSRRESPLPRRDGGKSSANGSRITSPAVKGKPAPSRSVSNGPNKTGPAAASSSGAGMSAKDRLKAGLGKPGSNLIALNSQKRDTRTIDEIERDMRRKREDAARQNDSSAPSRSSAGPSKSSSAPPAKRPALESSTRQPLTKKPRTDERRPAARRRDESEEEDSDEYESESEDDHSHYRGRSSKISDVIYKLMGRDRQKDLARERDMGSDDDMEVSVEQMRREEARAARLGAREDQEEQQRLERAAEEKRRRLKGK